MKNTVKNAVSIFGQQTDLSRKMAAAKAAKEAAKAAKEEVTAHITEVLKKEPGLILTCSTLADAFGVSPSMVAQMMHGQYRENVRATSVDVTRHYVEVDENGEVIKGAPVKHITKSYTGFRYTPPRR